MCIDYKSYPYILFQSDTLPLAAGMTLPSDNFDFLYKLVVIGDSGVGKTNLLSRFSTNQFSQQSKPTIGVEFATKTLNLQTCKIKAQVWDTAGQERFRAITHAYYKGATGALLVFDLTRRSSYDNLGKWLKQLKDNAEESIVCILVGNKSDLAQSRNIRQQQVAEFAQQNRLFYLQTSALDGANVDKAFMTVIREIYEQNKKKDKVTVGEGQPGGVGQGSGAVAGGGVSPGKLIVLKNEGQGEGGKKQKKKKCCE